MTPTTPPTSSSPSSAARWAAIVLGSEHGPTATAVQPYLGRRSAISKLLVTSVLRRFGERGTLSLNDRVIAHLPEL